MTLQELIRREEHSGPIEAWLEELRGCPIEDKFPRCLPRLAQKALAGARYGVPARAKNSED